jgi:lysine 2,3-aminomutase
MQEPEPKNSWQWEIKNRITDLEQLEKIVNLTVDEKRAIQYSTQNSAHKLKMAITPYFASLIDKDDPNCPIRRQCIPVLD